MTIQTVSVHVAPMSDEFSQMLEKDIPAEVVQLMLQSILLALNRNMLNQAQPIVDGLTPHFSKLIMVPMLGAVLASVAGRDAEALQVVERLMKSHPQIDAVACICASMRKDLGAPGWRALAQRVIDRGEDADAVGVAEALLAGPTAHLDKLAVPSAGAALGGLRFA